jgi:hypothetical protein
MCVYAFSYTSFREPKIAEALKKVLETDDLPREFNLDTIMRNVIIKAAKNASMPSSNDLNRKSAEGSVPSAKKKKIANTASETSQKIKFKIPASPSHINESRINEIMAAFITGKKSRRTKVFQVRLVEFIDPHMVRTVDPMPQTSTPSRWDLPVNAVVDYKGLNYSMKDFQLGDFVYSLFCLDSESGEMSSEFYPGSVAALAENDVTIQFEDSDSQAVKYDQLFKMSDVKNQELVKAPMFK